MKRRDGSSRRQVLDVDNPSTSWKSKFQAMTERRLNGSFQSSSLSKLVGSYASESDEEDGAKSKSSLDAKVDEFMKEVESTKGSDDASIIPCAWQECYDEGTGYPYYWNMNTNEVTWEPPPELVAYQAAVAAKLAQTEAKVKAQVQQAQWAVEQAALGITPEHPSPPKKISAPAPSQRKPLKFSSSAPAQSGSHRNHGRNRRPSSESDDEKIEMITSWVDEESEEEEEVNESQNQVSNNKKQIQNSSVKQSKPPSSSSSSSRKTEKLQKQTPMGPIGPPTTVMFGPKLPLPLSDTLPSKLKSRSRNGSTEEANEVESKVVIQKLRRLKTESDVIVGTRERVPVRKSLDRSRSGSPNDRLIVNSSKIKLMDGGSESESGSEKSMLSRLQKQVEKLRDLGGSVPNDIKDLLISATKSSSLSSMTSADNIIALIEMEQPPDHKQDDKLLLSLKAAEQRVIRAVDKMEAERISNGSDKAKSQAQKPSSFALIAGYGDDSDQEEAVDSDTSTSAKDKAEKNKTLFPILGHEDNSKSDTSSKSVGKLTVGSDSVTLKANLDLAIKPSLVLDHGPGQKRKKRLDIGTIISQPLASSNSSSMPEVSDDQSKPKGGTEASASGTGTYTTVWSSTTTYSSDPTANDRRGFGFQVAPSDEEITAPPNKPKKGQIQFIKAETINRTQDDSKNVRDGENEVDAIRKDTTSKSREDGDLHRSLSSLAQLVKAKLQFLNEGKEPVSPVQAMAIQIETLVSAWNAGALANSFLQRWLQSTGAELVQLERAAAPQGWAVQWDREYKRYFYCNLATKDTQWDYPVLPEDGSKKTERKKEAPNPEAVPRAATPPPDDEDAMELCTTPPPEDDIDSTTCATPPRAFSPPPNPPPSKKLKTDSSDSGLPDGESLEALSALGPSSQPPLPSAPQPPLPSSPPPPPPPPDSPPPPPPPGTPPSPTASSSSSSATTGRVPELGEPLPPGVDNPADIPFIPVRPALPPALPPAPMGHPGPGAHPGAHPGAGTHPMGADLSQVQVSHMALNPLQTVGVGTLHPGSVLGVPVLSGVGVGVPHAAMAMPYSGNVAVSVASSYPASTEAMLAGYNAVDYMGYMGVYAAPAGPLQVASVAAPPLQYTGQPQAPPQPPTNVPQRRKELMSELSSFYSDIASLDSNSRDATEDDTSQDAALVEPSRGKTSTPPVPVAPVATSSSEDSSKPQHSYEISPTAVQAKSQGQNVESTADTLSARKKKKPKLAPGLTLKKKGVSNMVAKWQQVQEEVWKDYRNDETHE